VPLPKLFQVQVSNEHFYFLFVLFLCPCSSLVCMCVCSLMFLFVPLHAFWALEFFSYSFLSYLQGWECNG
jgi:hypothetical protein